MIEDLKHKWKHRWKRVRMNGHPYRYRQEIEWWGKHTKTEYLVEDMKTGHRFWQPKKDIDLIVTLRAIRRMCLFLVVGGFVLVTLNGLRLSGVI